jgi:DNA topoisomerase-3
VLKGMTIIQRGWMKYDDGGKKDKLLPALSKGDKLNIHFKPVEKQTSPPKHYTIETLNNYLKNPFREEKASIDDTMGVDDAEEYRAMFEGVELGTEATRTGIIDNARKSGYIKLTKDVYTILPEGEFLVESLDKMNISMDKFKTSEMGKALKKVYRGDMSVDDAVGLAKNEISSYFNIDSLSIEEDTDIVFFGDAFAL